MDFSALHFDTDPGDGTDDAPDPQTAALVDNWFADDEPTPATDNRDLVERPEPVEPKVASPGTVHPPAPWDLVDVAAEVAALTRTFDEPGHPEPVAPIEHEMSGADTMPPTFDNVYGTLLGEATHLRVASMPEPQEVTTWTSISPSAGDQGYASALTRAELRYGLVQDESTPQLRTRPIPDGSTAATNSTAVEAVPDVSSHELLFGPRVAPAPRVHGQAKLAQGPTKTAELNKRYGAMPKRDRDDIKSWVRHAARKRVDPSYADLPPAVPRATARRLLAELFPAVKTEAKREYEFSRAIKHKWLTPN